MLPSGKIVFLLLVVSIMTSPHQVISQRPICTRQQKNTILNKCNYFIRPGDPIRSISRNSPCCAAVRTVPDRNMQCVITLLTPRQQAKYSAENIRALQGLCKPPPPDRQMIVGTCTTEQKEAVLHDCKNFVMPGNQHARPIPIMEQPCCNAVNKVPKKAIKIDMQCIVEKLTDEEKNDHDVSKILNLPNHC